MFFSTTDERGVIQESNNVFIRLSRYSRDQLAGAPHNIIRHPCMPGGAFYAMWNTLHAGKPFVAYVHNLAKDGSQYDVLATVTPLKAGGYLSVRMRACCTDIFNAASSIYEQVRELEDGYISQGCNRREAAEKGAGNIIEKLNGAGFPSYDEFQWTVLPAEVMRREAQVDGKPPRRDTATGELRIIHDAVHNVCDELNQWMGELERLGELSTQLKNAGEKINQELDTTGRLTAQIEVLNRESGARYEDILMPLRVWVQMRGIISAKIVSVVDGIAALDRTGAETRFGVALARLQTTMMANFVAELIDGEADEHSAASICMLAQAIRDGVEAMQGQTMEHRRQAEAVETAIKSVISLMEIPQQLITDWQAVSQRQLPSDLTELLRLVSGSIEGATIAIANLKELVTNIGQLSRGFDISTIIGKIDQVERETSVGNL
ncbi:hypothetical protein [Corynebacterium durum]|uniref:hypothetical protein n=1 Tax=Corynebacterium durum TaxID=61592 RepID=UPI00389AA11F